MERKELLIEIAKSVFPVVRSIYTTDSEFPLVLIYGVETKVKEFPFDCIKDFLVKSLLYNCPYYLKEIALWFFNKKGGVVTSDLVFSKDENTYLFNFLFNYYDKIVDFQKRVKKDASLVFETDSWHEGKRIALRLGVGATSPFKEPFFIDFLEYPSFEVVFNLIKYLILFSKVGSVVVEKVDVLEKIFGD